MFVQVPPPSVENCQVPLAVPSLFHSSLPLLGLEAVKKTVPLISTRLPGPEPIGTRLMSLTSSATDGTIRDSNCSTWRRALWVWGCLARHRRQHGFGRLMTKVPHCHMDGDELVNP